MFHKGDSCQAFPFFTTNKTFCQNLTHGRVVKATNHTNISVIEFVFIRVIRGRTISVSSSFKLSVFSPALIPLSLDPRVGHAVHADPVHFVRHSLTYTRPPMLKLLSLSS